MYQSLVDEAAYMLSKHTFFAPYTKIYSKRAKDEWER